MPRSSSPSPAVPERGFDPLAIIAALDRHGTRYVLIGGMASRLHGAPLLTEHPQLVPATDPANLRRLADALRELDARLAVEGVEGGLDVPLDERTFTSRVMGFDTSAGPIDVALEAIGLGGYDDLASRAVVFDIGGVQILVAALDDIITSKAAADRPEDRLQLDVLRDLRDELRRRGQRS